MARTTRPVERGRGNGTEIVRFGCGKRHVYIGEAIADAGGGVTKPPGRSGWKGGRLTESLRIHLQILAYPPAPLSGR